MEVFLDIEKYNYDVYHILSLFFKETKISFSNNGDFKINIKRDILHISYEGDDYEYNFLGELSEKENIKMGLYKYLKSIKETSFPYGTLVGIGPSKISSKLISKGMGKEEVINYYHNHYLAYREKAELCYDVSNNEKEFLKFNDESLSIYIGMPFCPTRCVYCSFASNPIKGNKSRVKPYLEALSIEIEEIGKKIIKSNKKIKAVYFGGGTPTSIDEESFNYIMEKIYNNFVIGNNVLEFTVECGRADSISEEKLQIMKKYKVDRISINPQTMNDKTLNIIGRSHSSKDVIDKFNLARKLSFENINMDIIIGLEGEGLEEIKYTLDKIEELNPDSITIHGLSIKKGSELKENYDINNSMKASEKIILEMYKECHKRINNMGMIPYYMYRQKNIIGNMENVGYCYKGKEGSYNINMIEDNSTILAFGADAVSKYVNKETGLIIRQANPKDVIDYINRIDEIISKKEELFFKEEY